MTFRFGPTKSAPRFFRHRILVVELLEDRRVLSNFGLGAEQYLETAAPENLPTQVESRALEDNVQILGEKSSPSDSQPVANRPNETESAIVEPANTNSGSVAAVQEPVKSEDAQAPTTPGVVEDGVEISTPPNTQESANSGSAVEHEDKTADGVGRTDGKIANSASEAIASEDRQNPEEDHVPPLLNSPPSPAVPTNGSNKSHPTGDGDADTATNVNEQSTDDGDSIVSHDANEPSVSLSAVNALATVAATSQNAAPASGPSISVLDGRPTLGSESAVPTANAAGVRVTDGSEIAPSPPPAGAASLINVDELFGGFNLPTTPELLSSVRESIPQVADLLGETVPFDLADLDAGLRNFLNQLEDGALELVHPEMSSKLMSWIFVGVLATATLELARRQLKRTPALLASPDGEEERSSGLRFRATR